jgi:hypothetical protein
MYPSYCCFCSNGHKVEDVPESCLVHQEIEICPFCKSTKFYNVLGWHDREPETCLIPHVPIGFEWVRVWNDTVHGEVKVLRFDVSKVSRWIDRSKGVENGL